MSNHNHTAADALALAATCDKRASSGTGVALNPAATDMVAKALRFWAEHKLKFNTGDSVVLRELYSRSAVYRVCATKNINLFIDQNGFERAFDHYRLATPEEIEAGHRIDNQNTIKC